MIKCKSRPHPQQTDKTCPVFYQTQNKTENSRDWTITCYYWLHQSVTEKRNGEDDNDTNNALIEESDNPIYLVHEIT